MSDPKAIYLQPECCADPNVGRLWCEDDSPVDCEDGAPWTKYVLAAAADAKIERLQAALAEIREEWAGAECGEPVYAQEAYAIGLAKRMYRIAVDALQESRKPNLAMSMFATKADYEAALKEQGR